MRIEGSWARNPAVKATPNSRLTAHQRNQSERALNDGRRSLGSRRLRAVVSGYCNSGFAIARVFNGRHGSCWQGFSRIDPALLFGLYVREKRSPWPVQKRLKHQTQIEQAQVKQCGP